MPSDYSTAPHRVPPFARGCIAELVRTLDCGDDLVVVDDQPLEALLQLQSVRYALSAWRAVVHAEYAEIAPEQPARLEQIDSALVAIVATRSSLANDAAGGLCTA